MLLNIQEEDNSIEQAIREHKGVIICSSQDLPPDEYKWETSFSSYYFNNKSSI